VALPDASICLHYMLVRLRGLIDTLEVDDGRMLANLDATNGLVFSQALLLGLIESGMTRDQAYRVVQRHAMSAWEGEGHLRDLVGDDPEVALSRDALEACFSLERIQPGVETVFSRLGSSPD
jgi:adenylosuccinate lyase